MAETFGVTLKKTGKRRGSMTRTLGRRGSAMRMSATGAAGGGGRRGSASFHMFKDLEAKQECQKLRLASFLRELQKLAKEDTTQKVRDSLGSKASYSNGTSNNGQTKNDGSVNLEDLNLAKLTPRQANETIDALMAGGTPDSTSLIHLIREGVEILSQEDTVVDLREIHPELSKVTVVGDLHGSLNCLKSVLDLVKIDKLLSEGNVVIFDGDFVDRGEHSLEVICTLLLLKLSHPKHIILLRGNHEDSMTASTYGFRDEIEDKYGYETGDEIWFEFGLLFAAFPIIARTNTAAIMHGGIPDEDFSLEDVNAISKETRCELKTISDPYDDDERLLQGILWSDPTEEEGISLSDRGAGYCFGPDISKDFLERHELKYIIRAHEPFEDGFHHHHQDIGGGRGVVTIFSTANYPCGEGENMGAVLHLDDEIGMYETESFIHNTDRSNAQSTGFQMEFLKSVVDDNKSKLTKAFRSIQNAKGHVTCEQWEEVLGEVLDLPDVPWLELQPELAPTTESNGSFIDWVTFLDQTSTRTPHTELLEKQQLTFLHEHQDKFLSIFRLLDTDGNGSISKKEFASGMEMLSQQIPGEQRKKQDAEKLFHVFDLNGDGEISIESFCQALKESATLQGLTDSLDLNQVEALQENHEMLQMAFKYLDKDHSGAIDRGEFTKGIEILNNRLPTRNQLGDPEVLFKLLDLDGNGEIDLNEFNQLFRVI